MKTFPKIIAAVGVALFLSSCSAPAPAEDKTGNPTQEAPAKDAPTEEAPEEVKPLPFNASGLLAGNAAPEFEAGKPGELSVVHVGKKIADQGVLLFAFRNNTDEAVAHVDWSATARSAGSVVGSGSSQGTDPSVVQPGEVALSYIYFDNIEAIPDDAEYEFSATSNKADTSSFNTAALKVTEANLVGESIVGEAVNEGGADATGPFGVSVYCFKGDEMVDHVMGYTDQDDAADGKSVSFSEELYGKKCSTFAVGVSGYFK